MTVLATTVLVVPVLPEWMKALLLIIGALGVLLLFTSRVALPEGMAKRLVIGCVAALAILVIASSVVHAAGARTVKPDAIYIGCDQQITWWDWVWWVC